MAIGYVLDRFPSPYQTFVLQEMIALEERGLALHVFSLRPPGRPVHDDVARLRAAVTYVPPLGQVVALGWAELDGLRHRPSVWLGTLWMAARGCDRLALASWLRGVALAPAVHRLGVKHLHAHFAGGANLAAMVASRLTGGSFSFTSHAVDLYARPVLLCETLAAARFAVTISQYNRRFIAVTCGDGLAAKVHVVRAGIDPQPWTSLPRQPHHPPAVLSVGRLVAKKGHADLIMAAAALRDRGVACQVRIVGDGPERRALEAAIAQHQLSDRVAIVPPLTQAELRSLYGASDVVVLPCIVAADGDRDGIPVSLMEALAAGLPVVSTTISGIPELVDDRVGILVPPRSPDQLATAIATLLADPARRVAMGEAGAARVREHFTAAASAAQLHELFEGVLRA